MRLHTAPGAAATELLLLMLLVCCQVDGVAATATLSAAYCSRVLNAPILSTSAIPLAWMATTESEQLIPNGVTKIVTRTDLMMSMAFTPLSCNRNGARMLLSVNSVICKGSRMGGTAVNMCGLGRYILHHMDQVGLLYTITADGRSPDKSRQLVALAAKRDLTSAPRVLSGAAGAALLQSLHSGCSHSPDKRCMRPVEDLFNAIVSQLQVSNQAQVKRVAISSAKGSIDHNMILTSTVSTAAPARAASQGASYRYRVMKQSGYSVPSPEYIAEHGGQVPTIGAAGRTKAVMAAGTGVLASYSAAWTLDIPIVSHDKNSNNVMRARWHMQLGPDPTFAVATQRSGGDVTADLLAAANSLAIHSVDDLYPARSMVLFMKSLSTRKESSSSGSRRLLANATDLSQPSSLLERWPPFAKGAASRGAEVAYERRLSQVINILDNFPRVTPEHIKQNACSGCSKHIDIFRVYKQIKAGSWNKLTFGFEAYWDFDTAMSVFNSRRVDAFVATELFSKAWAFSLERTLFSARMGMQAGFGKEQNLVGAYFDAYANVNLFGHTMLDQTKNKAWALQVSDFPDACQSMESLKAEEYGSPIAKLGPYSLPKPIKLSLWGMVDLSANIVAGVNLFQGFKPCARHQRPMFINGLGVSGSIKVTAVVKVLGGFLGRGSAKVTIANIDAVNLQMYPVAEILTPSPNFWPACIMKKIEITALQTKLYAEWGIKTVFGTIGGGSKSYSYGGVVLYSSKGWACNIPGRDYWNGFEDNSGVCKTEYNNATKKGYIISTPNPPDTGGSGVPPSFAPVNGFYLNGYKIFANCQHKILASSDEEVVLTFDYLDLEDADKVVINRGLTLDSDDARVQFTGNAVPGPITIPALNEGKVHCPQPPAARLADSCH